MTTPPERDATQPYLPPPPPGPSVSTRPPGLPPPHAGGSLTTGGAIGLVLIVVSVIAILAAVSFLGAGNATSGPAVADVEATRTPAARSAAPSDEPSTAPAPSPASTASPTPSEVASPEPGSVASPVPAGTPSPIVKLPKLTATITGSTAVRYYAISGDSPVDLIRQMERKGSSRCDGDALACVRLQVDPGATYAVNTATGSCTLTGASPTLSAVVQLPRWTKPARVHRALVAWWRDVFDHISWHEGRHIQIERTWMRKLGGMLEGKPCASAARVIRRWARQVAAAQDAFDTKDRADWTYPAYFGPGGFYGELRS